MSPASIPHPDRRRAERRQVAQPLAAYDEHHAQKSGHAMRMGRYGRFAAMVAAATAIGYGAMYLDTYEVAHVFFSWTRFFMSMIMGGVMTAVMMLFMWGMYPTKRANWAALGARRRSS